MSHVVSDLLCNGLGYSAIALTILRVLTGLFFVLSGYHKLTNATRHKFLVQTLKDCRVPFVGVMQWFVPSVEFLGGLGVVFGFLTPLAAIGLVAVCGVATCTAGLKRIAKQYAPIDRADYVDDVLYLPEVLYILMLLPFVASGAGPLSLDYAAQQWLGLYHCIAG